MTAGSGGASLEIPFPLLDTWCTFSTWLHSHLDIACHKISISNLFGVCFAPCCTAHGRDVARDVLGGAVVLSYGSHGQRLAGARSHGPGIGAAMRCVAR